jgi:hypothetical protein
MSVVSAYCGHCPGENNFKKGLTNCISCDIIMSRGENNEYYLEIRV